MLRAGAQVLDLALMCQVGTPMPGILVFWTLNYPVLPMDCQASLPERVRCAPGTVEIAQVLLERVPDAMQQVLWPTLLTCFLRCPLHELAKHISLLQRLLCFRQSIQFQKQWHAVVL